MKPSSESLKLDATAVARHLLEDVGVDQLIIHGESIGGMAAAGAARALTATSNFHAETKGGTVSLLICDRTFCNLEAVAQRLIGRYICTISSIMIIFLVVLSYHSFTNSFLNPSSTSIPTTLLLFNTPHPYPGGWAGNAIRLAAPLWSTDVAGDFLAAKCPKIVANDAADEIIHDYSSLKSGVSRICFFVFVVKSFTEQTSFPCHIT